MGTGDFLPGGGATDHAQRVECTYPFPPPTDILPHADTIQVHAHLASHFYLSSSTSLPSLTLSLRHFARSVELNDSYLRGYYGLKFVAQKMLPLLSETTKRAVSDDADVAPPTVEAVRKLEELATRRLAEMVRLHAAGKGKGWDEGEVGAVREMLGSGR